jgi:hypothetical protein
VAGDIRSWIAKTERKLAAMGCVARGKALFEKEQWEPAKAEFEKAREADPDCEPALRWLREAISKLASAEVAGVAITETTHADSRPAEIERAAAATVAAAFADMNIDVNGVINYMKFIKWFKSQLKKHGHVGRISDETLQKTMMVWKEVDTEGQGCDRDGLGKVMSGMIGAGMIRISADGKILSQQA